MHVLELAQDRLTRMVLLPQRHGTDLCFHRDSCQLGLDFGHYLASLEDLALILDMIPNEPQRSSDCHLDLKLALNRAIYPHSFSQKKGLQDFTDILDPSMNRGCLNRVRVT